MSMISSTSKTLGYQSAIKFQTPPFPKSPVELTRTVSLEATRVPPMSGPECCQNPPAIASGGESGEVLQIASLNSYVSGNPDLKIAVLLVTDIYGYGAPKLRKLADKVASAGYYVVVPDFFHGDPMTPESKIDVWLKNHAPVVMIHHRHQEGISVRTLRFGGDPTVGVFEKFRFLLTLTGHQKEQAVEFAKPVIQALRDKGISKIGAAGFCWGAKVVVELAKNAEIQVGALLHPSFVTLDDIKGVKVPLGILGAEIDQRSPPEVVKEFEAALEANQVDHFVKIYPGVAHGWTVRYKDEDAAVVKCAEEAHGDLVDWFGKCL